MSQQESRKQRIHPYDVLAAGECRSIGIQVIKGIDMDAEKPFGRMTFRDKVSFCILCGAAEKRNGRVVNSNRAEFLPMSVDEMEDTERLNSWKSASNASGFSFAFC